MLKNIVLAILLAMAAYGFLMAGNNHSPNSGYSSNE